MSSRIRIADLTLDTGRRTVVRGTKPIQLGPLTYKLLLALIEAAPEVATHDDLAGSVWDGRAVSPATISQRVKLLRDALSDNAANPRYIQVLHGQGYRLIPTVNILSEKPSNRRQKMAAAGITVGLVLVVVFATYNWLGRTSDLAPQFSNSIAVLPFVDMSPQHDQEYLAEGIAEEILNLLGVTTDLRVIARTSSFSFKHKDADIGTIRDVLNVANVLEGSVRKYEDSVRISVQLVDTGTGARIWSNTYDRELGDILSLQSDIAKSVAAALKVQLSGDKIEQQVSIDTVAPQAFDLYLRGLQQFASPTDSTLVDAAKFFVQSIEHDPSFAQAYYALGLTYNLQISSASVTDVENLPKLREIVNRGLDLAPDNAGLIALSGVVARFDQDFGLADTLLQQAMNLNRSDVWIRTLYAGLRLDQSYPDEALETTLRTIEIDPLNPLPYIMLAFSHIDLGNADEALVAASRFNQVLPPGSGSGGIGGIVNIQMQGDLVSGIQDWESALENDEWYHEGLNTLAIAFYSIGDVQNGNAWLAKARRVAPGTTFTRAVQAYQAILDDDIPRARKYALDAVVNPEQFTRWWGGIIALRIAVDALIERGEASRAVELMLELAPEWASYMDRSDIAPEYFSPAPYRVKSSYSSYPALYFPDLVRALRAAGNDAAAENMLGHLESILAWRQERGLLVEQVHVAEALMLRNRPEEALDALERAAQDGTIYNFWQVRLLHNGVFENIRNNPRFEALVTRVEAEMNRQRMQLKNSTPTHEKTGF